MEASPPLPPTVPRSADPLREQLLEAAARVFAVRGYSGVKISDIVKEAGLSSGAVYGRFASKNELLTEAITTRAVDSLLGDATGQSSVGALLAAVAERRGPLNGAEAIQLEAYVAARREQEVADAISTARKHWREALQPTVLQAVADGTISQDDDIDSILFFLEAVHLGLLLQRGAGIFPANPDEWSAFVHRFVASLRS